MLIVLSPSLERMLIEMAVGDDAYVLPRTTECAGVPRIFPPPFTTADRAAELLAATSALQYLRDTKASAAPEAERLRQRIEGLVATFIATQNQDGGWPWVSEWSPPPFESQSAAAAFERPPDLGGGRLGARLGRAARAADRRQGPRQGGRLPPAEFAKLQRQRSRDPRRPAPRAQHAARGRASKRPTA